MKKMDRRGFTLVEVLAVLVILTIILSIAIPSITASLERSKGKQVTASNELVLRAAELYVNDYKSNIVNNMDSDECYINVSDLRDEDYITSSNNDLYNIEYVIYNKTNNLISEIPSDKTVDNYSACNRNEYLIPEGDTGSDGSSVKYLLNHVHLGDYVRMVPSNSSDTGFGSNQGVSGNVNPGELESWRVIKITNNNIEIISEHISSKSVSFGGIIGYKNFIYYLKLYIDLYKNDEFTIGTRPFGYCDNLTEQISEDLYNGNVTTDASNWDKSTESSGGGDRHDFCYDNDISLLEKAGVSLKTTYEINKVETSSIYWLASRYYMPYNKYYGRVVEASGEINKREIDNNSSYMSAHLRPIVILKRDVTYTEGEGTSSEPFVLG